jgi:hypothetical protein
VAGASLIRRVVEPAEAVVCMGRDDAECWADERMATPSRPAIGRITAQLAPDPFVLSLATDREGIRSPTRCSSTSTVGRPANARLRRPTRFEPRCAGEGRDPDPLLPEVGEVLVGIRTRSRNRSGCTAVGAGWSRGCPHADARCRRRRRNRWARAGRRAPGGERRAAERTAARAVLDLGQRLTQGSAPASVSPSPKGAARALALPSMIPSLPPPRPGPSKSGASGRRARRPGSDSRKRIRSDPGSRAIGRPELQPCGVAAGPPRRRDRGPGQCGARNARAGPYEPGSACSTMRQN